MKKYKLNIQLKSDLCVSDGGVYNSSLDTDICYDQWGFPFIPAKRIKGCLRECALELNDWGMDIPIYRLFGSQGRESNRGKVRIGDAVLKDYQNMREQAIEYAGSLVFHPQNVLNHFSYIRTQTSVDYETGTADPTTLRTIRVVNKGLKFVSEVEISDSLDEKDVKAFEGCCRTLTNIGMGRTRGLGEIETTLESEFSTDENSDHAKDEPMHTDYLPSSVKLFYELELQEPMICKSINGGETRSLDYIEGSKILGLIIDIMKKQGRDFMDFMSEGQLFCSNAYLMQDGIRCLEVPANYYSVKNDRRNYLEKTQSDKTPESLKDKQLDMMGHCYVRKNKNGELIKADVGMEERYHHSRPEDKSIGRADPVDENSRFYQMSSIQSGQKFGGYITGSEGQIKTVYDCLSSLDIVYLGYSHSSEYGKTKISVTGLESRKPEQEVVTSAFSVKLESPAIIYNNRAFYSTSVKDLNKEIQAVLHLSNENIERIDQYVNYTTVGGYNVTWGERKPTVEAFDKGTVLYYQLKSPVCIKVPSPFLIGERVSEGYGEVSISFTEGYQENLNGVIGILATEENENRNPTVLADSESSLAYSLCQDLFKDFVHTEAITDADRYKKEKRLKAEKTRPTVSNMLLMCQGQESFAYVMDTVEKRYGEHTEPGKKKKTRTENKKEKHTIAKGILNETMEKYKSLPGSFCEKYNVEGYSVNTDLYQFIFLEAFLQELKYDFRTVETKISEEEP